MDKKLKRIILAIFASVLLIVAVSLSGKMFENVDSGEIVVIQDAIDGDLHVFTTAGIKPQWFGTATHYKRSFQYSFTKAIDAHGDSIDASIKVRFNDGGHAQLSGAVRVDLPLSDSLIIMMHRTYGNQQALENQLMSTVITKSVYMTGPLMSSKESYAEKRNDLISYIEDQASNGVYKTTTIQKRVKDPMDSTVTKTVSVVEIIVGTTNQLPLRQEQSPITKFGVKLNNLSISSIDYDANVEKQIEVQQKATMQVQTAIANAKRAEQDKFTVEQQGMADAAKAKWEQEVIKAQKVTQAEQELEVAKLNKQTEEQNKIALTLKGEGEAAYKKAVTLANNNFDKKADIWLKSQELMWDAFAKYQGNMVPTTIMGSTGSGSTSAMDFMQIMTAKSLKDLSLDVTK